MLAIKVENSLIGGALARDRNVIKEKDHAALRQRTAQMKKDRHGLTPHRSYVMRRSGLEGDGLTPLNDGLLFALVQLVLRDSAGELVRLAYVGA